MSQPSRRPHPAIIEARELLALEQACRDDQARRLERAVMLAPTLAICKALLRGEAVPQSQLDPSYFHRYGIRRAS